MTYHTPLDSSQELFANKTEFERTLALFTDAPYAVMTDLCEIIIK